MLLSAEIVEQIHELVVDDSLDTLHDVIFLEETLPGAFALACLEATMLQGNSKLAMLLSQKVSEWAISLPILGCARLSLRKRGLSRVPQSEIYGSPSWEVASIPVVSEIEDPQWGLFFDRFRRSMTQNGFSGKLPRALAQALNEMADNVIRHSGASAESEVPGLMGYQVFDNAMVFAVADLGRGILASLRSNPIWEELTDDAAALNAAVLGRATSDPTELQGNGFEQVHRSLVDLNGCLLFRSGVCELQGDGRGEGRNFSTRHVLASSSGLQLAVMCSLGGKQEVPRL